MIFDTIVPKPHDRRLAYEIEELGTQHCLTVGTGTYFGETTLTIFPHTGRIPNVLFGRFSSLAEKMTFLTAANHDYKSVSTAPFDFDKFVRNVFGDVETIPNTCPNHYQVVVGHDVWIGYDATILGGVHIANGAVVGTKAVVTRDVPPYAIVAGNPARVVKYRFDAATIKKFLAVKWWNWSLEKIKANLPLMSDVEKFLSRHWSPELEQIPEDEIGRHVDELVASGMKVYNFVADFQSPKPLLFRVVAGFCRSRFEDAVLVVWLDENSSDADLNLLATLVKRFGVDAGKNIFVVDGEKISPHALRHATHFITNREMSSIEALDWLWDTNVKIVSALDDNIFDGEPPVDWKNIFGGL